MVSQPFEYRRCKNRLARQRTGVRLFQSSSQSEKPAGTALQPSNGDLFSWTMTESSFREDSVADSREIQQLIAEWNRRSRVSKVTFSCPGSGTLAGSIASVEEEKRTRKQSFKLSWYDSPSVILLQLENPKLAADKTNAAILRSESIAFSDKHRTRLLAALSAYIINHRFAQNDDLVTVVGSAIRKYALNMSESDFESYARWLYPVEGEYPTHRVELELVKAICWRLTFEPTGLDVEYKDLAETLFAIAYEYSTSRFLPRKNHGAIALNAAVSIFILDAISGNRKLSGRVVKRIEEADSFWFKEMLIRRLGETVGYISAHSHLLSQRLMRLVEDHFGSEP